ncbi:MAG: 50S ribosomal protein L3 [Desulfurococcales archaeon]|nr:50S ribosomal protein L3 [Desulfurococcales archaeon]
MARRKHSAPRRGSLGVRPRKRASKFVPRVRSWPAVTLEGPQPLGFLGYKVGMTHIFMIDDRPGTLTYEQEIFVPATVIETPPMVPVAARFYVKGLTGLRTYTEVWATELPEGLDLKRKIKTLKVTQEDVDKARKKLEALDASEIARVTLLMASQPRLAGGLSKKKPDIIEVKLSDNENSREFALSKLGKEIRVSEVFKAGQFVDVIGVTKGKGFQGVIKRFGVKELPRWTKHRKGSRRIGARSPGLGTISPVPQAGQMGFHRRTELNKRILIIGSDPSQINPVSGFPHYGLVKSDYIVVKGTVQGTPKRPLILRWPVRPPKWTPDKPPKITYVSLESKI